MNSNNLKINLKNKEIYFSNGNTININKDLFLYLYKYVFLYIFLQFKQAYNVFSKRKLKNKNLFFYPDKPKPLYSIYNIIKYSGLKIQKDINKSNIVFFFDDKTISNNFINELGGKNIKIINKNCNDISKNYVGKIFEEVFNYGLSINPFEYKGKCVSKSNINGAHDGKIIKCPIKKIKKDTVYQKLIDNKIDDEYIYDIRCPIIGKQIPFVYIKKRPLSNRFSNNNTKIDIEKTSNYINKSELKKIISFSKKIGLDFGELDILRDNKNKKIYIVDVNKTSLGPPSSLKYLEKINALKNLSEVFKKEFLK